MVIGEDRAGQVVETAAAGVALVTLAMGLGVVPTVLDDLERRAMRASHTVGPTHRADGFQALGVVDEVLDVHHRSRPSDSGEWATPREGTLDDGCRLYRSQGRPEPTTPQSILSLEKTVNAARRP